MKKILIYFISLVLMASCSVKTNEEKARELIEPEIKANLVKPESYEFANMKLDSCFMDNGELNPEALEFSVKVAKLYKEYKKYSSEAEDAESSMTIYAPRYGYQSAHSKQQYQKYKAEMEKAQRKAATAKENILKLYKDNVKMWKDIASAKHEFTGWAAEFNYRAETAGGIKTMGSALIFLNKDLTEITHSFSSMDLSISNSELLQDFQYDFGEELKAIYQNK